MSAGGIAGSGRLRGSIGAGLLLGGGLFMLARTGAPDTVPDHAQGMRRGPAAAGPSAGDGGPAALARPVAGARPVTPSPRGGAPVFGLARPGRAPGEVLFARARKVQPGGPETTRAAAPSRYLPVRLAPDAEVWLTAPLADRLPADHLRGVRVEPQAFGRAYRSAQRRLGGAIQARAHMFEIWLDADGRAVRLKHFFSP